MSTWLLFSISGKLSLEDLKRVYFSMKDTVFKRQSKLISHICDTKALEDLLKGTLGTVKTMDSVKKPKYNAHHFFIHACIAWIGNVMAKQYTLYDDKNFANSPAYYPGSSRWSLQTFIECVLAWILLFWSLTSYYWSCARFTAVLTSMVAEGNSSDMSMWKK